MTLEIRELRKRLGKRQVLNGVTLRCAAGEAAIVLGHNGSGKSTLLRLCAGIIEPDEGAVRIDGYEVGGGGTAARRRLGYVPDNTDPLPDLLVAELCALTASLKQAAAPPQSLIDELGVTPFFKQRLATLSFGQRKRACLLAALIGQPKLLILDEPTNGLDPEGVALIVRLIESRRRDGLATLLATNDQPFADALGRTQYQLQDGRVRAVG